MAERVRVAAEAGPGEGRALTRYVGRRLLGSIPLLLGILTLLFFILHLAPGDPTAAYANPSIPPRVIAQMRHNLGLDQPLPVQYLRWLGAFLHGDLGYSLGQHRPVVDVLAEALPNTLLLSGVSLLLIFLLGCGLGIVQAVRQYSLMDSSLTLATLFIYSMPGFWLAIMLVLLFSSSVLPGWMHLPVSGITGIEHQWMSPAGKIFDRLRHLILPTISLGVASAAGIARYMRGSMLEVVRQDYVRTARAKGLDERRVILKHALRNALLPIVSLLGLYVPLLFGGSVVIEVVFAWPGMGNILYTAVQQRDYPVVMGASALFAVLVLLGNLAADLLYAAVDPRIRYEEAG